jgi:hypothetical protein
MKISGLFMIRYAALALCIFTLSGCVKTKQNYWINEDGSGKMKLEMMMSKKNVMRGRGQQNKSFEPTHEDTIEWVNEINEKLLKQAEGIRAWKNLDYGFSEDGDKRFSGTFYFADITEVRLGKELPSLPVRHFNEDRMVWKWPAQKEEQEEGKAGKSPRPWREEPLSDEEVQKRVEDIQGQFEARSAMMQMAMQMFEYTAIFHLPYKIKSVKNGEQTGTRTVKVTFEGDRLMERYEKLMENEEALRRLVVEEGVNSFDFDNKKLARAAFSSEGGLIEVHFRTGLFAGGAKNYFSFEDTLASLPEKKPALLQQRP